nr:MAG TPA: hypothetical protein [Caudoviricetes sp.]
MLKFNLFKYLNNLVSKMAQVYLEYFYIARLFLYFIEGFIL